MRTFVIALLLAISYAQTDCPQYLKLLTSEVTLRSTCGFYEQHQNVHDEVKYVQIDTEGSPLFEILKVNGIWSVQSSQGDIFLEMEGVNMDGACPPSNGRWVRPASSDSLLNQWSDFPIDVSMNLTNEKGCPTFHGRGCSQFIMLDRLERYAANNHTEYVSLGGAYHYTESRWKNGYPLYEKGNGQEYAFYEDGNWKFRGVSSLSNVKCSTDEYGIYAENDWHTCVHSFFNNRWPIVAANIYPIVQAYDSAETVRDLCQPYIRTHHLPNDLYMLYGTYYLHWNSDMAYPEYRAAYGDEGKIMHSGAQWLWVSDPEPAFCSATGCQAIRPSTGHFCPEHEEWDWTFDHSEYGEISEPIPMEMFNTRPDREVCGSTMCAHCEQCQRGTCVESLKYPDGCSSDFITSTEMGYEIKMDLPEEGIVNVAIIGNTSSMSPWGLYDSDSIVVVSNSLYTSNGLLSVLKETRNSTAIGSQNEQNWQLVFQTQIVCGDNPTVYTMTFPGEFDAQVITRATQSTTLEITLDFKELCPHQQIPMESGVELCADPRCLFPSSESEIWTHTVVYFFLWVILQSSSRNEGAVPSLDSLSLSIGNSYQEVLYENGIITNGFALIETRRDVSTDFWTSDTCSEDTISMGVIFSVSMTEIRSDFSSSEEVEFEYSLVLDETSKMNVTQRYQGISMIFSETPIVFNCRRKCRFTVAEDRFCPDSSTSSPSCASIIEHGELCEADWPEFDINNCGFHDIYLYECAGKVCSWVQSGSVLQGGEPIPGVAFPIQNVATYQDCSDLCERETMCNGFWYNGEGHNYPRNCYLQRNVQAVITTVSDSYAAMCSGSVRHKLDMLPCLCISEETGSCHKPGDSVRAYCNGTSWPYDIHCTSNGWNRGGETVCSQTLIVAVPSTELTEDRYGIETQDIFICLCVLFAIVICMCIYLNLRKAQKASAQVVSKRLPNAADNSSKRESNESMLSTESLEVIRVGSKPEPVKEVKQDDVSDVDVYTPQQPKNGDHANAKRGQFDYLAE